MILKKRIIPNAEKYLNTAVILKKRIIPNAEEYQPQLHQSLPVHGVCRHQEQLKPNLNGAIWREKFLIPNANNYKFLINF
jgi:hypothetical protein